MLHQEAMTPTPASVAARLRDLAVWAPIGPREELHAIAEECEGLAVSMRDEKLNEPGTPMYLRAMVCDWAARLAPPKEPGA